MIKNRAFYENLRVALSNRTPKIINCTNSSYIHAAVLIPLFRHQGEDRVLFTKRSHFVENHKGQISFPGGVVDERDSSYQEAALREADEEIGLFREDVKILGQIDDRLTNVSNFVIHPFVGSIPYPYSFQANPKEVERIIDVPLSLFHHPKTNFVNNKMVSEKYSGHVYPCQNECIWGATAGIMENFMEILEEINLGKND